MELYNIGFVSVFHPDFIVLDTAVVLPAYYLYIKLKP